ncbi:MAG: poly-beta-1,6-N-acetyl-D-glucosamine biosynthesis protein PgaD [Gammaproteobacteria bacterium]|nr:MAG: poly-beta-1,6-N-acetyl-D-glucosamine biosynthesis protein PgaD [Gammaproteobacteria bacterium]
MANEFGNVIINARNVVSRRIRNRDRFLTTLMWALYAYLWLPLISLGAWYIGVQFAYDLVLWDGGTESLVSLLLGFLLILLFTALVVILWSWVQRTRFAQHERRVSSPSLPPAKEQAYWKLSETSFEQIRTGRRLFIDLDETGSMIGIET